MTVMTNESIAPHVYYKLGGMCKELWYVANPSELTEAVEIVAAKKEKYFICGQGSNLIFAKNYFDGIVIQVGHEKDPQISDNGDRVTAFAGESLDRLIEYAFTKSLIGLEWAGGLPGTIGAAVRGNVGAYGGEIKDNFVSAQVLEIVDGKTKKREISKKEMHFSYRGSLVKNKSELIILSATFKLNLASEAELSQAREAFLDKKSLRHRNHPLEYPNCGSVFKNLRDPSQVEKVLTVFPDLADNVQKKWYGKIAVASVIERLGLKGYRVGNAQISEKHALFIVNLGGATADDALSVIKKVEDEFEKHFGFKPETEVEIVR